MKRLMRFKYSKIGRPLFLILYFGALLGAFVSLFFSGWLSLCLFIVFIIIHFIIFWDSTPEEWEEFYKNMH